jgi:hypothetical protein
LKIIFKIKNSITQRLHRYPVPLGRGGGHFI